MCYTARMRTLVASILLAISTLVLPLSAQAERSEKGQRVARDTWSESRGEDLTVQLVTFGAGDAIHQYFGHNAMVVTDRARGMEAMYNFGMFGFGPDMLPKYLQGKLDFWAAVTPVEETYARYIESNRGVRVLELNLPPERKLRLAQRLAFFVRPENRVYRYDHYRDNCSTKLRDLIDEALDGELKAQNEGPARFTYRGHTARYTERDPFVNLLLTLWMNDSMERPIRIYDQAFLPDELERLVAHSHYRDAGGQEASLVGSDYTLYAARRPKVPESPTPRWPAALGIGVLIGGAALALGRWLAAARAAHKSHVMPRVLFASTHSITGLVLGVPGLVAGLFLLTEWEVTHWNECLFFANPLSVLGFLLGPAVAFGSQRALRVLAVASFALAAGTSLLIVLKLLPMFDQHTGLPLALYAPINFGFAAAHALIWRAPASAVAKPAPAQSPVPAAS
jgi:hypothetical protein